LIARFNFEGECQLKVGTSYREKDEEADAKNKSIWLLMILIHRHLMKRFMGFD
jgi:hypothetical protein